MTYRSIVISLVAYALVLAVQPATAAPESVHVQVSLETALFADVADEDLEWIEKEVAKKAVRALKSSPVKFFDWTDAPPAEDMARTAARLEIAVVDSATMNAVLEFRVCKERPPKDCELGSIAGAPPDPIYKSGDLVPEKVRGDILKKILEVLEPSLRRDTTAKALHERYLRLVKIGDSVKPLKGLYVGVPMDVAKISPMPEWQLDVVFNQSGQMQLYKLRSKGKEEIEALISFFMYGRIRQYDPNRHQSDVKPILDDIQSAAVMVKCFINCTDPTGLSVTP